MAKLALMLTQNDTHDA